MTEPHDWIVISKSISILKSHNNVPWWTWECRKCFSRVSAKANSKPNFPDDCYDCQKNRVQEVMES